MITIKSSYGNYLFNKIQAIIRGNNSVAYWNTRYKTNWEICNGRLQTALFASAFVLLDEKFIVSSILDYGCGCGDSLPILKMKYAEAELYYYDFSKEAMKKANHYYSDLAKQLDEHDNMKYDLVYCSNVIEHVPDVIGFVNNIIKLSNKYIVIQAPYNERHDDGSVITINNKYDEHVRTITENMLDDLKSFIDWKCVVTTVPYAWNKGDQIFFIGTKLQN